MNKLFSIIILNSVTLFRSIVLNSVTLFRSIVAASIFLHPGVCGHCAEVEKVIIEAEDYRDGGEGVAYHDNEAENLGETGIREDEGVDIYTDGETIRVGHFTDGEWLTYDHTFPSAGTYLFRFYVATKFDDRAADIYIDDEKIGSITVPNTGSYAVFEAVDLTAKVEKGDHIIKIEVIAGPFDFDHFQIKLKTFVEYSYLTYFSTTENPISIIWDPVTGADYYETRLYNFERLVEVDAGSGRTTERSITFYLPRSGHYSFLVRACIDSGDDTTTDVCSVWADSTETGSPSPWWLYGYIASPGEIIIENH